MNTFSKLPAISVEAVMQTVSTLMVTLTASRVGLMGMMIAIGLLMLSCQPEVIPA